jgi:hypothetical protein
MTVQERTIRPSTLVDMTDVGYDACGNSMTWDVPRKMFYLVSMTLMVQSQGRQALSAAAASHSIPQASVDDTDGVEVHNT